MAERVFCQLRAFRGYALPESHVAALSQARQWFKQASALDAVLDGVMATRLTTEGSELLRLEARAQEAVDKPLHADV